MATVMAMVTVRMRSQQRRRRDLIVARVAGWCLLLSLLLMPVACGDDEPTAPRTPVNERTDNPVPHAEDNSADDDDGGDDDSSDTGENSGGETPADNPDDGGEVNNPPLTISIEAPATEVIAGQSLQLQAHTSREATLSWTSSNTAVARVDNAGLVQFLTTTEDHTIAVTASAEGVTASISLLCHGWQISYQNNGVWKMPGVSTITIARDGELRVSARDMNGAALPGWAYDSPGWQWQVTALSAMGTTITTETVIDRVQQPAATTDHELRLHIAPAAPQGTLITITAIQGIARQTIMCMVM